MLVGNLTTPAVMPASGEFFEALVQRPGVRIERIISHGHCSEAGFWYEQKEAEWVMVVQGEARLRFEQGDRVVELKPGDWVEIAARERHRVEWTTPEEETVWVAVFYS
ncbi:MAG: cupin domain-containing protein [Fluviicoccus sp.]|uniref:cupin domain-containing protein n=1 Tax=Fluviicoccus sp. TaxID=2003552 RepID=UPI0027205BBD|nr:cupin domain-containing protein [Fluviicoccus sp.]MDO8331885.1 cupin domain-containing protein [Fluviicoccus sp.]